METAARMLQLVLLSVLLLIGRTANGQHQEIASLWIANTQAKVSPVSSAKIAVVDVPAVRPLFYDLVTRYELIVKTVENAAKGLAGLTTSEATFVLFGNAGGPPTFVLGLSVGANTRKVNAVTGLLRDKELRAVVRSGVLYVSNHKLTPAKTARVQRIRVRNRATDSFLTWSVSPIDYLEAPGGLPRWVTAGFRAEGLGDIAMIRGTNYQGAELGWIHEVEILGRKPRLELQGAASALDFRAGQLAPEPWVPAGFKGTYFSMRFDTSRAWLRSLGLMNRLLGAQPGEDLIGDVLEGIEKDDFGPQVRPADILGNLEGRITVLTDWPSEERSFLIAMHVRQPALVRRVLDKILANDRNAFLRPHSFRFVDRLGQLQYDFWEVVPPEPTFSLLFPPEEPQEVEQPIFRAVTCIKTDVNEGILLLASSPKLVVNVLDQLHQPSRNRRLARRLEYLEGPPTYMLSLAGPGRRSGVVGEFFPLVPAKAKPTDAPMSSIVSPAFTTYSLAPIDSGWRVTASIPDLQPATHPQVERQSKPMRPSSTRRRRLLCCWRMRR